MAELIELGSPVGWGLTAPPGTPKIRVQALRTAFNKMVKSRAFLVEAKARKTMVRPATGMQVQGNVNRTLKVSPRLVAKIRKLAGFYDQTHLSNENRRQSASVFSYVIKS